MKFKFPFVSRKKYDKLIEFYDKLIKDIKCKEIHSRKMMEFEHKKEIDNLKNDLANSLKTFINKELTSTFTSNF